MFDLDTARSSSSFTPVVSVAQCRFAYPSSFPVSRSIAQIAVPSSLMTSLSLSVTLRTYATHPLQTVLVRNQSSSYRHSLLGGFLGSWRRFGGSGEYLAEDKVFSHGAPSSMLFNQSLITIFGENLGPQLRQIYSLSQHPPIPSPSTSSRGHVPRSTRSIRY